MTSAHLDVRHIFGEEYAFRAVKRLVRWLPRPLMDYQGYERDYVEVLS